MEIIKDLVQGSDEWFELRALRMTASHAQAIGNVGSGLDSYINKKMREYYQITPLERYQSKAMIRGNELEPYALDHYELETFSKVKKIGFVVHNEFVGASPDAFVDDDGLAEIKCPESKEYFNLLMDYKETGDLKIDKKYLWQMQMQIMVCKKKFCDYVVYSPDYEIKMMKKRVLPDFDMWAKLGKGFDVGEKMIKNTMKIMEAA